MPWRPTSVSAAAAPGSAGALLDLLASRRARLRQLRGTAKLEVFVQGSREATGRLSTTQAVLVRAPASFRLESISPFGVSYAVACDGQDLAVMVPSDGYVYRAEARPDAIAAATGVEAAPAEIAALLLGLPPVPRLDRAHAWVSRRARGEGGDAEGAEIYLHAPSARSGETVVVGFARPSSTDGELVPVLFERIGRGGDLRLRARFADFRRVDGVAVATTVSVEAPGSRAVLRYRNLALDGDLRPGSFSIATPPGMREAPFGPPECAEPPDPRARFSRPAPAC